MASPFPDPPSAPQDLATRVEALAEALSRLEARVRRLEQQPDGIPLAPGLEPGRPGTELAGGGAAPSLVRVLALSGQVCLILGGAFLLRSLTDAGTLPRTTGVGVGLAYALAWGAAAWRASSDLASAFLALASVMITCPLVWEATTTFSLLPPPAAAAILLAASALHLAVAWARSLQAVAWIALLAVLGTAFGLMAATQSLPAFTLLFLAYGGGTLWLTYGRKWHALRWPAALAADVAVLVLALVAAWPGGPPEGYRTLSPRVAMGLSLALVVLYLGSFAARMLQRRRTLNAFEVVQSALVLTVGFGGALRVALVSGSGAGLLGAGVLVAGAGCYGAASPFAADREDLRANFSFFTTLALAFLLIGGPIVLRPAAFALGAGALGLASLATGLRLRRTLLLLQSALALGAAAVASGLLAGSWRAFLGEGIQPMPPSPAGSAVLAALAAGHAIVVEARPGGAAGWRFRLPSLVLGLLAVLGVGAVLVWLGARLLGPGPADPGQLAALRTGVLALAAIGLAALGRALPTSELTWLVYPLLGLAAAKFLVEDLSVGRPLTLFPALMGVGLALILAPRLLRTPRPAPPDEEGGGAP